MKAIRVHQYGGLDALSYDDMAVPQPNAGEVRIKVGAAGLNFIDTYKRAGVYKSALPIILGEEAAGTIDAVGEGVRDFNVGDAVAYCMHTGAYAEYSIVPAWKVVKVEGAVSAEIAAAVMLQGLTAHYLATSTYPLKPGDTALVHAAAGGTGALLVQMAKLRGAKVIGTVSTEEKAEIARAAGADEIIFYTQQDFVAETKRITNGKGVHVVYDGVGKSTFMKGLDCLRPRGYAVLFGGASGQVEPFDLQLLNAKGSLFTTRPSLGAYIQSREELLSRTDEMFGWIAAGKLQVRIDKSFALKDAGQAHAYIEGRETKGKVLLVP
ncbi:MAG: quinone oxidoreductase [Caldilineaceae bacterium]